MANIAYLTSSASGTSYTNTRDLLTRLGHAVTSFSYATITSSNLSSFDLIVLGSTFTDIAGYAQARDYIKGYAAAGKPILVGFCSVSTAAYPTTESMAIALGIMSSHQEANGLGPSVYADVSHPVITAAGFSPPVSIQVYSGASYIESIPVAASYVGTALMSLTSVNTRKVAVLVDKGITMLSGVESVAKLAWLGWLYGGSGYGAHAAPIVREVINWLLSASAVILGSVEDESGAPLERTVRAYVRENGAFAGETTSAADGSFKLPTPYPTDIHFVVAFDELSGEKNAIIKDRVLPYVG